MASTAVLYSPEVLGLATSLSNWPLDDCFLHQGEARSRSCGSLLRLGLALDDAGRIARVGIRAQACAVGQAAAAIFAGGAPGMTAAEIESSRQALEQWLTGQGGLPDWPGLAAIAPARDYPGRHGAIMLAWNAATELLPTIDQPR